MTVKLPNGLTLEGTTEQIKEVLNKIGYSSDTHYYSESKGTFVLISDMSTTHLRNSIFKFSKKWLETVSAIQEPHEVASLLFTGITNASWIAMVKEYSTRTKQ